MALTQLARKLTVKNLWVRDLVEIYFPLKEVIDSLYNRLLSVHDF